MHPPTIAAAVWSYSTRTLATGTPDPPTDRAGRIAQAVWQYVTRTLGGAADTAPFGGIFTRAPGTWVRIWRYYPTAISLTKLVSDDRDYFFDFSEAREVVAGDLVASVVMEGGSGLTIGLPTVLFETEEGVKASRGVKVEISGGTAGQTYSLACVATLVSGRKVTIPASLVVVSDYATAISLTKLVSDDRDYLSDFNEAREVVAGDLVASAVMEGGAGLTIGLPTVLFETEEGVKASRGVKVEISGGTAGQTYSLACVATLVSGRKVTIPATLVVVSDYG